MVTVRRRTRGGQPGDQGAGGTSSSAPRGSCNGPLRPRWSRSAMKTCSLLPDPQTRCLPGSPVLSCRPVRRTRLELPRVPPQPVFQRHGRPGFTPLSQRAFPDDCDPPADFEQIESIPTITLDIGVKLCQPELLPRGRGIGVGTVGVPVPEAAMHEAHGSEASKHEVRGAGKPPVVQAVSEAASVNSPSKEEFGPRIPASDPGHHARTGRSVHYVRHRRRFRGAEEYMCPRVSRQSSRIVKTGGYPDSQPRGGGLRGSRSAIRSDCLGRADDGSWPRRRPRVGRTGLPRGGDHELPPSFPSVWGGS